MKPPLLKIENVSKSYGRTQALSGLSLVVPRGVICGLVGENGAGKTTSFSLIGGFLRPDSGTILLDGMELRQYLKSGQQIGILPQDMLFYEHRTISRQLSLFARLVGFHGYAARNEVQRVLEAVGLAEKARAKPHELSRGMRVRLGIAQALIGSPALVLLDEPLAGLDPRMKRDMKELIVSLKKDTTFVISSHELSELQEICDYFCMMGRGKLVRQGAAGEILNAPSCVVYRVHSEQELLAPLKEAFSEYEFFQPEAGVFEVKFHGAEEAVSEVNRKLLAWFLEHRVEIYEVVSRQSLERVYLSLADGD